MLVRNLTPHDVIVVLENETTVNFPATGVVARVTSTSTPAGVLEVEGLHLPLVREVYGEVENLPDPDGETFFIVSSIVASAAGGRNDLLIPNDFVRDEEGRILGCRSLRLAN